MRIALLVSQVRHTSHTDPHKGTGRLILLPIYTQRNTHARREEGGMEQGVHGLGTQSDFRVFRTTGEEVGGAKSL